MSSAVSTASIPARSSSTAWISAKLATALSSYRNEHIGFVFQSFNLQGSIVVTHDLDIARQASTVLSIQDGVVRQTQGAAGGVATQGATVG